MNVLVNAQARDTGKLLEIRAYSDSFGKTHIGVAKPRQGMQAP